MKKSKFILKKDPATVELTKTADKKTLALWAIDCAERVMPYFEKNYPQDNRPRKAIDTLKEWIKTGEFKMSVIRKASLDSHTAARDVGEDSPACSAARAAGQAVATAHVWTHAIGSAMYAQQAKHLISLPEQADIAATNELKWQYNHLKKLQKDN
jgi:hypothetical protein